MLKNLVLGTVGGVLLSLSSASAAELTIDFSSGGPTFISNGVTFTPSCTTSIFGGTCQLTQNGEGLGVTYTGLLFDDTNGDIDGFGSTDTLIVSLTNSLSAPVQLRLLSVLFENDDNDGDGDEVSLAINGVLRASGSLNTDNSNALGAAGATIGCEINNNDDACLLNLNGVSLPLNFTGSSFAFSELDTNDDYRVRQLSFLIPDSPTTSVPEPTTLALFAAGLLGLAGLRHRQRSAKSRLG